MLTCVMMLAGLSIQSNPRLDNAEAFEQSALGWSARDDGDRARSYFLRTAESFETDGNKGLHEGPVARNIAQSYFLSGDLAKAIVYYHRGLLLTPQNDALRHGLASAREQVKYPDSTNLRSQCQPADQTRLTHRIRDDIFQHSISIMYLLAWLVLARAWMTGRPIWRRTGRMLLILSIVLAYWRWWDDYRFAEQIPAPIAVVADETSMRSGNGDDYPLRFTEKLPVGVEMHVVAERGGWLQVQLAGGVVGWVEKQNVITVD